MPTGYTAAVGDGEVTEFSDFAMTCARAFGALVTMRDEPADAPVPDEFPVDEYPMRMFIQNSERLNELRAMSLVDADVAAMVAYSEAVEEYRCHQQEQAATRARYEAMLDKVRAWRPPTPDHVEMKKFMVQQLEQSIRFDCGYERPAPVRQDGATWVAEQIAQAERNAERYAAEHEKAVERAEQRTAWVRALRESLRESVSS